MAFYIHPPHLKRAAVTVVTLTVTITLVRTFPSEAAALAHGFREGIMTLLIEHILHNWGVIFSGAVAMVVHTIHGD